MREGEVSVNQSQILPRDRVACKHYASFPNANNLSKYNNLDIQFHDEENPQTFKHNCEDLLCFPSYTLYSDCLMVSGK